MELGSVTLKRIGFFCFPIKHSTHTAYVSVPTCIHLLVFGRLVGVSVSESMSPRSVSVVAGSVYSPSDPLFLFGLLWFSRGASACRLEEVPGSIKSAKTLVTRHIEQRVVNTHNPSAYFPSISEHFSPPSRNMHGNFITEER